MISLISSFSRNIIVAQKQAITVWLNKAIDTLVDAKCRNVLLIVNQPVSWQINPNPKRQSHAFGG